MWPLTRQRTLTVSVQTAKNRLIAVCHPLMIDGMPFKRIGLSVQKISSRSNNCCYPFAKTLHSFERERSSVHLTRLKFASQDWLFLDPPGIRSTKIAWEVNGFYEGLPLSPFIHSWYRLTLLLASVLPGFESPRSVIGLKNLRHFLNQSEMT